MNGHSPRPPAGRGIVTAALKRLSLLFLLFSLSTIGCSGSSGPGEVRIAYERFVAAVLAEDSAGVARMAPFLRAEASGKALGILKDILAGGPAFRVRMIDDSNAEVILSDPRQTVIPFKKSETGEWLVHEQVARTQFIEFVPAR